MKDPRVEGWLKSFRLSWKYEDGVALERIQIDKEAKENIRLTERIDEDLVLRYGVALENGAAFPAIVVYVSDPGVGKKNVPATPTYGMISGWHRTETFRLAEKKSIAAYVVHVSDKLMISVLRRTANTLEGKPPTMAEMIEHAVWLVKRGYNQQDAARLLSVPNARLSARIHHDRVRLRLATVGIAIDDVNIAPSALSKMSQLRDPHLKDVVELAHEARLSHERVSELIRQVREAPSDEAGIKIIGEWRKLYAEEVARNKAGSVRDPASELRRIPAMLKQVERIAGKEEARVDVLRPHELRLLKTTVMKTIRELEHFVQRIDQALAAEASKEGAKR